MAKDTKQKDLWLGRVKRWGEIVLRVLGTSVSRVIMVSVAVIVLGWLMYRNVLIPLQSDVAAPGGISLQPPVIDVALLESISDERVVRSRYVPQSFSAYDQLFTTVVVPSP